MNYLTKQTKKKQKKSTTNLVERFNQLVEPCLASCQIKMSYQLICFFQTYVNLAGPDTKQNVSVHTDFGGLNRKPLPIARALVPQGI